MNISSNIAKTIKIMRKERRMTQEQLASLANITTRSLQRLEAGENQPTYITLFRLAFSFGVEPGDIILRAWQDFLKWNLD